MPKDIAYTVSTVVEDEGKDARWTCLGVAFENKDGSLIVLLDAVPVNGRLILQKPK